jgi:predicted MPP superfamily phosphohydrolase
LVDTSRLWAAVAVAALLVTASGTILAGAALAALRRWLIGGGPAEKGRPRRALRALRVAVLILSALTLAGGLWAWRVEPYWPQVERLRVETGKLPAGTGPVRIALLADTHCDPRARAEPRIPELVRELAPHAIVFAGDAINSQDGLPHFRELVVRLAEVAPTWAVRGNWEIWWFQELDVLAGTGVGNLEDRAVPVRAGGAEVWLCGSPPRTDAEPVPALGLAPEGRFKLFVHHYPEVGAEVLRAGGADLAVGGDTHGGQIRLPLLGALVRISRCGEYFDIGAHRVGGGTLYVNRGIGCEGGTAPRVRLMCRPEITLIEIVPKN